MSPLASQLINLFAAILLLLAFAMLSQRRVLSLVHLFTLQGAAARILKRPQPVADLGFVAGQPSSNSLFSGCHRHSSFGFICITTPSASPTQPRSSEAQ